MKDPGFIAEAAKQNIEIAELEGEKIAQILNRAFAMPPEVIRAANERHESRRGQRLNSGLAAGIQIPPFFSGAGRKRRRFPCAGPGFRLVWPCPPPPKSAGTLSVSTT